MPNREISAEELREDLEEVKAGVRDIIQRFDRLDERYLRRDVSDERYARRDAQFDTLHERVNGLESRVQWAWRAAITGVLLPTIATLVLLILTRGSGT